MTHFDLVQQLLHSEISHLHAIRVHLYDISSRSDHSENVIRAGRYHDVATDRKAIIEILYGKDNMRLNLVIIQHSSCWSNILLCSRFGVLCGFLSAKIAFNVV